jgi:3-isopropylmalate/(R)-2-methylmalate dehydratase large subunit
VRVTVTPSSHLVDKQAEGEGILELFRTLGAVVTPPGCGSCIGNGPGIPLRARPRRRRRTANFDRAHGRAGPVYLVSPAVAAASAVTGRLTDPRTLE